MARLATGESSIHRLESSVNHATQKTRNLGELFNEAKKNQPFSNPTRKSKNGRRITYDCKKSGVVGLYKMHDTCYMQKFCFRYAYFNKDGKQTSIQRRTLRELYDTIIERGLSLEIINNQTFCIFLKTNCNNDDYQYLVDKIWEVENGRA